MQGHGSSPYRRSHIGRTHSSNVRVIRQTAKFAQGYKRLRQLVGLGGKGCVILVKIHRGGKGNKDERPALLIRDIGCRREGRGIACRGEGVEDRIKPRTGWRPAFARIAGGNAGDRFGAGRRRWRDRGRDLRRRPCALLSATAASVSKDENTE